MNDKTKKAEASELILKHVGVDLWKNHIVIFLPRNAGKSLYNMFLEYNKELTNVGTPGHCDYGSNNTLVVNTHPIYDIDLHDIQKIDPSQNYLKFNKRFGKLQ